jgi:putative thioredoxin
VDGFQGALPESQVKAFIDRLAAPSGPSDIDALLEMASESASLGDLGGAAQAYAQILQLEPAHVKAIAGLARCYLSGEDLERAKEVLAMAPPQTSDPDLKAVESAIALAEGASGEAAVLERRVLANPSDLEARYDLAAAHAAKADYGRAVDQLLAILAVDKDWREGQAKRQLLTVFEAAGPGSDIARAGRRKLSSLLFA